MASESSTISERIDFQFIFSKLGSARLVGIQLPDGLKYYAGEIADRFREKGYEVIISGKPSYGACDIDISLLEVVDVLLHFGHTEMLSIERVIYVPYNIDYSVDAELLRREIKEKRIAIIGTASYAWKFESVAERLRDAGFEVELRKGKRVAYPGQVLGCNYSCLEGTRAEAILFIGDGEFHAIGASLYAGKRVYAYSPLSGELRVVDTSDFVRRRYFQVSRAKMCDSFAILVSTKPGQKRLGLAMRLKRLAEERGVKAEIILTDEISPSLVESFRFDCYVSTACPRIAYDDYRRFSKPVITPQEFEIVLGLSEELTLDLL
ncbi:diphthamide biosynthesis enzyme Dph2 [Geoglobus ahangari]